MENSDQTAPRCRDGTPGTGLFGAIGIPHHAPDHTGIRIRLHNLTETLQRIGFHKAIGVQYGDVLGFCMLHRPIIGSGETEIGGVSQNEKPIIATVTALMPPADHRHGDRLLLHLH